MGTGQPDARRLGWAALSIAAIACLGTACSSEEDPHESCGDHEDGHLGSAVSALDSVCTADPTKGLATVTGFSRRWWSSFVSPVDGFNNQHGFDMANLTATGPTCRFGSNRNDNCCDDDENVDPFLHMACKQTQENNAIDFIEAFSPRAPLISPVGSNVTVGQGYYYNGGGNHAAAVDLYDANVPANTDPTFPIYAAGDGEVVYAGWYGSTAGNVILVRHLVSAGTLYAPENWYLTEYRHVRGGATHDKLKFCPCINLDGEDMEERLENCTLDEDNFRQCMYTANPDYDYLWGTDEDALPAVGTRVRLGQQIAKAGNSGTVLANINPTTGLLYSAGGNTHLHFSLGAPTGRNDGSAAPDVVTLDVFGVYSKQNGVKNGKACYAPDAQTTFPRLLKPFDPDDYVALRNHPGLSCRPAGAGALVYSEMGAAVNETLQSESVICPAGRFTEDEVFSNYVFGRVWVDDQSTTDKICCHVLTKNASGALREGYNVCSTGTGRQSLVLDYPKVYDPNTFSHFDISCTLPASSGGTSSSSILAYRVQQQRF